MKKLFTSVFFLLSILTASAQMGIGTSTPDPSAALDITSTDKGLLIPRVTLADRPGSPGKPTPTPGLMVYQTDNNPGFYLYSDGSWGKVAKASEVAPISYAFGTPNLPTGYQLTAIPYGGTLIGMNLLENTPDCFVDQLNRYGITVKNAGTYRIEYDVTPVSVGDYQYQVVLITSPPDGPTNYSPVPNSAVKSTPGNPQTHGNMIKTLPENTKISIRIQAISPDLYTTTTLTFGDATLDHGISLKITRLK